jgi:hypothetical protein
MEFNIIVESIEKELIQRDFLIKKEGKERTSIKILDFETINTIRITEKLRNLPFFSLRYDLYSDYNLINIAELGDKFIEKYNIVTNTQNDRYVLMKYKDKTTIEFDIFFLNLPTPKLFIFHMVDSFTYILKSLMILNMNKICFFNVNTKTISFDKSYKPILSNFSLSIKINHLLPNNSINIDTIYTDSTCINEKYLETIIQSTENYTFKPLEIHVLFHLMNNGEETLSYSAIETICEYFVENNCVMDLFSQRYRENYYKLCVDTLKVYINKPKKVIINDILRFWNTWDNYSVNILYLFFIGNFNKVFSLHEGFLGKFVILLNKNIHPDPLKRESLVNTIKEFDKLFGEYSLWSFVNNLSEEKYAFFLKEIFKPF